jgi:hypothetical protein
MPARLYKNVCYPDTASLVQSLYAGSPFGPDTNGVIWTTQQNAVVTDYTGYSIMAFQLRNSVTGGTVSENVVLLQCDAQTAGFVFDKYPAQDILFFSVLVIVALIGFATGRSK